MKIQFNKLTGEIVAVVFGNFVETNEHGYLDADLTESAECYFVKNSQIVYRGPKPSDDYEWLNEQWVLNVVRQEARLSELVRIKRNELLTKSDWIVAKAYETQTPVPQEWAQYRQALRDIPQQNGFPTDVVFPVEPN